MISRTSSATANLPGFNLPRGPKRSARKPILRRKVIRTHYARFTDVAIVYFGTTII